MESCFAWWQLALAFIAGFVLPSILLALSVVCVCAVAICIGIYESFYDKEKLRGKPDLQEMLNAAKHN